MGSEPMPWLCPKRGLHDWQYDEEQDAVVCKGCGRILRAARSPQEGEDG